MPTGSGQWAVSDPALLKTSLTSCHSRKIHLWIFLLVGCENQLLRKSAPLPHGILLLGPRWPFYHTGEGGGGRVGGVSRLRSWEGLGATLGPEACQNGLVWASWAHLGGLAGVLVASWGQLGALLWVSWGPLGPLGGILVASWPFFGVLLAASGAPGGPKMYKN